MFVPLWKHTPSRSGTGIVLLFLYVDDGTDGREEERVEVIGRKARGKETTRKTET
jgi:hypothetical protein